MARRKSNKQVKAMLCNLVENTIWSHGEWCGIRINKVFNLYEYHPREDLGVVLIKANQEEV